MKSWMLLLVSALIVGCRDGRPTEDQARQMMQDRYPDIRMVKIQGTMDEVIAVAHEFTCITPDGPTNRADIQFMDDGTGIWKPRPAMRINTDGTIGQGVGSYPRPAVRLLQGESHAMNPGSAQP
jgi:hypothetical protein